MPSFALGPHQYQRLQFGTLGAIVQLKVHVQGPGTVGIALMLDRDFPVYVGLETEIPRYEAEWRDILSMNEVLALMAGSYSFVVEAEGVSVMGTASVDEVLSLVT